MSAGEEPAADFATALFAKVTKTARKNVEEKKFQPHIPADKVVPEFTVFWGLGIAAVYKFVADGLKLFPTIPVSLVGALIILIFGFFFATVSSRMEGLIGSSNNPVSGMAIAIGSVICMIAAMAGDTSQDLKAGFLLGTTPKKQQYGELIGVCVSAMAIGIYLPIHLNAGILLAVFAVLNINTDISDVINLGNISGLVFFALLLTIVFFCNKGQKAA